MTRTRTIVLGAAVGAAAGLVVLLLILWVVAGRRGAPAAPAAAPGQAETTPDANARGATPQVDFRAVTIYQRAATPDLQLAAATGRIVWFGTPVDRARQILQLVLDGVPDSSSSLFPGSQGVRFHDVLIDDRRIAWVDLDGASLDGVRGAEDEEVLVAIIARSLVEDLDEVDRVGVVVDGQPKESLAGHVDLSRTFTGYEWPGPPVPTVPAESEPAGAAGADRT